MIAVDIILLDGGIYLWLYVILFLCAVVDSSKIKNTVSKALSFIVMIILSLFIGLRWETGTDWEPYKQLFDTIELDWTFLINVFHYDLGYVLFNGFVRLFTNNYTVFLLLNSFITIFLLYKIIIKLSPYPLISFFFFYTNFMIAQFMGSNRRMMSMIFVLWFFYYTYRRSRKMILNGGLALMFHRSAIITLLVHLIKNVNFSVNRIFLALTLAFIIGILQLPTKIIGLTGFVLSKFTNNYIVYQMMFYSENNDEHLVSGTGSLIVSSILAIVKRGIFLIFYLNILKKTAVDDLTKFLYHIYILGFVGYLLFIGSFFQMLTAYFAFVEIILIGRLYKYTTVRTKSLFIGFILLFGFMQMVNALSVYPELYMPYIPFWSDIRR